MVRLIALLLTLMAAVPAAAQETVPAAQPPVMSQPMPGPIMNGPMMQQPMMDHMANPAASYITAGQDEPGYRSWYLAAPTRGAQINAFNTYLATYGVSGILPTWQMLRTATSWRDCGGQPFEVPPITEWPHIVQTLRYIHDYVIPAVGPVEPVSGYRNPVLNVCAGGAPESAHMHFSALDLVPLQPTTREAMMRRLCTAHARRGADYGVGLGFYAFLRFHVDTTKFRRWNMDPAVAEQCPPLIRPSDIASVGQPLPQQPAVSPPSAALTGPTAAPTAPTGSAAPAPPATHPNSSQP